MTAVGFVEIATSPVAKSPATHSSVATHEIASGRVKPVAEALHVGAAAVGSVEMTACPLSSIAAQRVVDEHEMPHSSGTELVSVPVASA